jgi:hypothetical protein
MMFGTILVSMTGIALPILAGVWLTPQSKGMLFAAIPQMLSHRSRAQWLLLRQSYRCLGLLSNAILKGHLPDRIVAFSADSFG